jgi:hypothetical protein
MWIAGTELREIEEALLQHMPGDDAAGPIRAVARRQLFLPSDVN